MTSKIINFRNFETIKSLKDELIELSSPDSKPFLPSDKEVSDAKKAFPKAYTKLIAKLKQEAAKGSGYTGFRKYDIYGFFNEQFNPFYRYYTWNKALLLILVDELKLQGLEASIDEKNPNNMWIFITWK